MLVTEWGKLFRVVRSALIRKFPSPRSVHVDTAELRLLLTRRTRFVRSHGREQSNLLPYD